MIIIKNETENPKSDAYNDGNLVITGSIVGIVVDEQKPGADYQDYMKNHCSLYVSTNDKAEDTFNISSSEGVDFGVAAFIVDARVVTEVDGRMKTVFKKEILVPLVGAIGCTTNYRTTGLLVTLGINNIIKEAQNVTTV